jgi:hypothetical protein
VTALRLSPKIVTDDAQLAVAVDAVFRGDDEDQRHCLGIDRRPKVSW